ncbi:chorismate pyruvate-lyase family protein [Sphaerisporangium sp. NPDC051017]|uniref:chorismate--pyruvate lyase family protein n=1 Tax=Sphaerisporangium sp. NPDC051017 TaxID=3154636 RepID=UPI00342CE5FF
MTRPPATSATTLIADRFIAQDRRPDGLTDLDVSALPPLLRTVLVSDSTVTSLFEAYTMRPLRVDVLAEDLVELDHGSAAWLEVPVGTACARRRVLVRDAAVDDPLYCAQTYLLPGRLPQQLRDSFMEERLGIGAAIRRHLVESLRELLWFGRAVTPNWARDHMPARLTVHRTYRIRLHGLPAILAGEDFCD